MTTMMARVTMHTRAHTQTHTLQVWQFYKHWCTAKHYTQVCLTEKLPVIFTATLGSVPVTLSFGSRGSSVMRHLSNWIVKLVGCSKCIGVTMFLVRASSHFSSPTATKTYTIKSGTKRNYSVQNCQQKSKQGFWDVIPYQLLNSYWHFEELLHLHLQGQAVQDLFKEH